MSDEYEYEDDERSPRRFTFGQIMLSLLLLGVVVVIGLIVMVYFALTERKPVHHVTPASVSAPVRPVERFTPDGKPVTTPLAVTSTSSPPTQNASEVAAQQKAADEEVNRLQNNRSATQIQQGALVAGAAAGAVAANQARRTPKPRVRRQTVNENGEPITPRRRSQQQANNANNNGEEVPLQPVQRSERRLVPRNQQGERQLTPRRQQNSGGEETVRRPARANPPSEQRERQLTPTRPNSGRSEAIEQLF